MAPARPSSRPRERWLRPGGRLLVVHDYGRDDVSRLFDPRPEYGDWSRRDGPFLGNGFKIRVVHSWWTFDSIEDTRAFLADAFGQRGADLAASLTRPRLSYNVAVYHRTFGGGVTRQARPSDPAPARRPSGRRISPGVVILAIALVGSFAYLLYAITVRDPSQIPLLASGAVVLGLVFAALAVVLAAGDVASGRRRAQRPGGRPRPVRRVRGDDLGRLLRAGDHRVHASPAPDLRPAARLPGSGAPIV